MAHLSVIWLIGWCEALGSVQAGVDLTNTFSLIVKPVMIHIVLQLMVSRAWPGHQMDGSNAICHGHLNELVYC